MSHNAPGKAAGTIVSRLKSSPLAELIDNATSNDYDASQRLAAVQAERATALYGVPAMFIAELGLPDFASYDLSSLRTGMMAGAPCPIEVMKRVICEMHCPELTIGYGQTESTPVVTMSELDDPLELRVCTVGKALPSTEMKIASLDDELALSSTSNFAIQYLNYINSSLY